MRLQAYDGTASPCEQARQPLLAQAARGELRLTLTHRLGLPIRLAEVLANPCVGDGDKLGDSCGGHCLNEFKREAAQAGVCHQPNAGQLLLLLILQETPASGDGNWKPNWNSSKSSTSGVTVTTQC